MSIKSSPAANRGRATMGQTRADAALGSLMKHVLASRPSGKKVLVIDVGGNVKDGCHIASMGGTWMALTYGFGGMRDDDGTLSFWPHRAPEDNAILRFPVTYRGQMLQVEIGLEKVQYALREGERLVIRHETEEVQLTRENPVAVRPVSRR